jgi:hypothetical protein
MSKQHAPGFLALVEAAKTQIKEMTIDELLTHQEPYVIMNGRPGTYRKPCIWAKVLLSVISNKRYRIKSRKSCCTVVVAIAQPYQRKPYSKWAISRC